MRIGIFGNDNNCGLLWAEALQRLGHSPRLVLTRTSTVHRPEGMRERFRSAYPDWVLDASTCLYDDYACRTHRLYSALNFVDDCDLLVLNHAGVSLADLWAKPYVCLLTGVDLLCLADYRSIHAISAGADAIFRRSPAGRVNEKSWMRLFTRQRDHIAAAARVIHPPRGVVPQADALLDEVGVTDDRRACVLAVPDSVPPAPAATGRIRVVCVAPPRWPDDLPVGMNAAREEGFARLAHAVRTASAGAPAVPFDVVIVDPESESSSQQVVAEAGVANLVSWQSGASLETTLATIASADAVVDPFGVPAAASATWSALAAGKPVVSDVAAWAAHFPEPVPACATAGPDGIGEALTRLSADAARRADLGSRAESFAMRHLSLPAQLERLLASL